MGDWKVDTRYDLLSHAVPLLLVRRRRRCAATTLCLLSQAGVGCVCTHLSVSGENLDTATKQDLQ